MYVCRYVSMYVCIYVCVCMYVCMYVCIYICMFKRTESTELLCAEVRASIRACSCIKLIETRKEAKPRTFEDSGEIMCQTDLTADHNQFKADPSRPTSCLPETSSTMTNLALVHTGRPTLFS